MRILLLALITSAVVALPAPAQQVRTINPGMTTDEVRTAFGAPAIVREQGPWRYLFYTNGCLPRCGSDDVVFLQDGRVVAAVLRSPSRRFTGPAAASALQQAQPEVGRAAADGTAVRGLRVETREPAADLGVIHGAPRGAEPSDTVPAESPPPTEPETTEPPPPAAPIPADSAAPPLRPVGEDTIRTERAR